MTEALEANMPHPWSGAPSTASGAEGASDRMILRLCQSQVVCVTLFSRFALPVGSGQVPLALLISFVHLGLIGSYTRLAFSPQRMLGTCLVVALVMIESASVHLKFSALSAVYIALTYFPLVLTTPLTRKRAREAVWHTYSTLACFLAVLGLLQLLVQAIAPSVYLDPIQLVPSSLVLEGYNTTYPIMKDAIPTLKPNGMFMLEPSFLSQVVGVGLLAEILYFRRRTRIFLLGFSLLISFSGTGILLVGVSLLCSANVRFLTISAVGAASGLAALAFFGYSDAILSRVGEFAVPGSSANERFVAPYAAIWSVSKDSPTQLLFGQGAGQSAFIDTETPDPNYAAIPKVAIEYGMVGLVVFGFMWYSIFSCLAVPGVLSVAFFVLYFVASGALLQPFTIYTIWGLTLGFSKCSRVLDAKGTSPKAPLREAGPGGCVK